MIPTSLFAGSLASACCFLASQAWADVHLPACFSDHMVLQRELDVPVGILTCTYGASTAQAWMSR